MSTFGANLRREREMRGVPLDEIATATKISVRCLQALEAEEFSKLPGGIFTRSFIRAYAKYLGLNEETVMAEFQVVAPPSDEMDLSRLSPNKNKPPEAKPHTPLIVPLLIVVALGIGGYGAYRYLRGRGNQQTSVTASKQSTRLPAPVKSQPPAAPPTVPASDTPDTKASPGEQSGGADVQDHPDSSQSPASKTANDVKLAASDSGLTLQIAATEQVWVAVDADGKNAMQRTLKPNDIQTFKAKNSFDVMTGNAQGIILTLNGETLKPLGRNGEVKKIHLTEKDLKNSRL